MGELIVNGIKFGLAIAAGATFTVALTALLNLLKSLVFGSVIGEVFGLISMCLPFDSVKVFGAMIQVIAGVLGFLVAQKIWRLVIVSSEAV